MRHRWVALVAVGVLVSACTVGGEVADPASPGTSSTAAGPGSTRGWAKGPASADGTIFYVEYLHEESVGRPSVGDLYAVRPDGTGRRLLARGGVHDVSCSPVDGSLLFARSQVGRSDGVWTADRDGSAAQHLTRDAWADHLQWSPDGGAALYIRWDGERSGIVYQGIRSTADPQPVVLPGYEDLDVKAFDWAPDGRRIVVAGLQPAPGPGLGYPAVLVVELDGPGVRSVQRIVDVADPHQVFWGVAWSPSGDRIAFYGGRFRPGTRGGDRENAYGLYLVKPDGSGLTHPRGPAFNNVANLMWSPDGHTLAYRDGKSVALASYPEPSHVYLVDPDGTSPRRISEYGFGFVRDLTWSPDGQALLLSRQRRAAAGELVVQAPGSTVRSIVVEGYMGWATWCPDVSSGPAASLQ